MGRARPFYVVLASAGALATVAIVAAAAAPPPAAAIDLVPHRAAYRLSLAGSERSLDLIGADGVLGIEWRVACDGWLSRQVLAFTAVTQEGQEISYDVRFSSWESRDNDRLRFTVRRFDEGRLDEEFRGEAVLEEPGGAGVARFTSPEAKSVELPPGTMFPTEHMRSVLASAEAGERLVSHAVFDGSGFDALTQISAAIGRPRPGGGEAGAANGGASWPVSMAYYDAAAERDLPDFEAAFVLDDGGVLRELLLDYGDFQLSATLEDLQPLPEPDC
jgi:EipB-like